jgi:hypothetical protein
MAAAVADAGMDPIAFLAAGRFDAAVMQAVAVRHRHERDERDEQLSVLIANNVGKRCGL